MKMLSESICEFEAAGRHLRLAALPGTLALYGDDLYQFFENPEDIPIERLDQMFADDGDVYDRATLHKEGVTNKAEFIESLEQCALLGLINQSEVAYLTNFIKGCDCVPSKVREKLVDMGYSRIVPRLHFEDYAPAMAATILSMLGFIDELKDARSDA
jgi:hypothetical protein